MLIVQTPLRISLFGGGTDFPHYYDKYGGCALTTAIDKYIRVVIDPRIDGKTRISCTHIQKVNHVHNIKHNIIRETIKLSGMPMGTDILAVGDVPQGTGLGSSSTLAVGLLKAMRVYTNNDATPETIAREACTVERDILGSPIGVQDQYIASYGGFRFMEFGKSGVGVGESIPDTRDLNDRLMLFYTGVSREASSILSEQVTKYNDIFLNDIKEIAYMAKEELDKKNYDAIGSLLNESWEVKKKLASRITNDKIDESYQLAIDAGALGGKIAGAGGGGFLLVYSTLERKEAVRKALGKLRELPFRFEPSGSKVIFND